VSGLDITVVVATFGASEWVDLAHQRAMPSVTSDVELIHVHGTTLATARNDGLSRAERSLTVFLDADDELERGYLEAMSAATGDVRVPRVRYVRNGREGEAAFPRVVGHDHDCTAACLPDGNWIVVGAAVRTDLAREVGGFAGWPIYEDYDLWCRCAAVGAEITAVPDAVYRAHSRRGSRNTAAPKPLRAATAAAISRASFPPARA